MGGRKRAKSAFSPALIMVSSASNQDAEKGRSLRVVVEEVNQLADALATAISTRDARRVATLFVNDRHTVYVSDGEVIPFDKLEDTLARFYDRLATLEFHWEGTDMCMLGEDCASLLLYATYVSTAIMGEPRATRAVYTLLCVRRDGIWGILVAHKSTVQ